MKSSQVGRRFTLSIIELIIAGLAFLRVLSLPIYAPTLFDVAIMGILTIAAIAISTFHISLLGSQSERSEKTSN